MNIAYDSEKYYTRYENNTFIDEDIYIYGEGNRTVLLNQSVDIIFVSSFDG